MKSDDLLAIMDCLYLGAVNIFQANLDSFLLIAEELQLKGFAGKKYEKIKATTVFMAYKPNVPDTSMLSMKVGSILTLKDKDMLSKKPTRPQPIALA